jgi:hypothetical protein
MLAVSQSAGIDSCFVSQSPLLHSECLFVWLVDPSVLLQGQTVG